VEEMCLVERLPRNLDALGKETKSGKVEASSNVKHACKVEASSDVKHAGKVEASSDVKHVGKVEASSGVKHAGKVEASSDVKHADKVEASSDVKHAGKVEASSDVKHSSEVEIGVNQGGDANECGEVVKSYDQNIPGEMKVTREVIAERSEASCGNEVEFVSNSIRPKIVHNDSLQRKRPLDLSDDETNVTHRISKKQMLGEQSVKGSLLQAPFTDSNGTLVAANMDCDGATSFIVHRETVSSDLRRDVAVESCVKDVKESRDTDVIYSVHRGSSRRVHSSHSSISMSGGMNPAQLCSDPLTSTSLHQSPGEHITTEYYSRLETVKTELKTTLYSASFI